MNEAQEFLNNHPGDVADLMTALDEAGIDSEQDYKNEATTWTFEDGSRIKINNTDIEVLNMWDRIPGNKQDEVRICKVIEDDRTLNSHDVGRSRLKTKLDGMVLPKEHYEDNMITLITDHGTEMPINNEDVRVIKEYCTQNAGDCETCSLVNYGKDCRNNPIERGDDE